MVNSTLQKRHPTNVLSFRIFGNTADNENDPYDPDKRSNAHLERIQDVGIRIFKYFSTELKNWGRVMSRVSSLQVTCKSFASSLQIPCQHLASPVQIPCEFLTSSSQVPRKFPVPRVSREDRQKVPESLLGSYKERSGESLGNYRDDQCFEYCIYSICQTCQTCQIYQVYQRYILCVVYVTQVICLIYFFIWRETYINPREFPSSDKFRAKSSKFKASVKIQDNKFLINFLKFLQVIPYPLPVTHQFLDSLQYFCNRYYFTA